MDKEKLVSVIVPIYNAEKYLEKCITSICHQSYHNLEVVLVNDGSSDGSQNICERYMKQDGRLKLINKENKGAADAKNVALDYVHGDYVTFVDSDDYIEIDMIQKMLKKIENTSSDICICNFIREDENGRSCEDFSNILSFEECVKTGFEMLELLNKEFWWRLCQPCTKLYKTCLFEGIRFPKQIVEDLAVMHLLYDRCNHVCFLDKAFYHYVQQEKSVLHTKRMQSDVDLVRIFAQRIRYYEEKGYYNLIQGTESLLFEKMRIYICGTPLGRCRGKSKNELKELQRVYWQGFNRAKLYGRFEWKEYAKRKMLINFPLFYQLYMRLK